LKNKYGDSRFNSTKRRGKITTLNRISTQVSKNTATIVAGAFDPFNDYYREFLEFASQFSVPLIALLHTDKVVALRRGLILPSENQIKRALNLKDFVDYVVISSEVAHSPRVLRALRPKYVVLQKNNPRYQKILMQEIRKEFPDVVVKICPIKRTFRHKPAKRMRMRISTKNKIVRKLYSLAKASNAGMAKISAVLVCNGKIIAGAANSDEEEHAEILLLEKAKTVSNLQNTVLCILIPPCLMCAKAIAKSGIKRVYYLARFGDGRGIRYLQQHKIEIKAFKEGQPKRDSRLGKCYIRTERM